ncbi:MAG: hypothetical protein DRH89_03325 [Candidatus Cloacimonadota bacterium]|nr:MAG: hypothetical protein DRH89_03325 [Candidatus Cloacimonadota bacterium]
MSFYDKNDIIEMAIKDENRGYTFYNEASKKVDINTSRKKLFTQLRDEELKHEETFRNLRNRIDLIQLTDEINWSEEEDYIGSMVNERLFDSPDTVIQLVKDAKNTDELIDLAIDFEKETLYYFKSISKYITERKAKATLKEIINEEITHIKRLKEFPR